jgi:hypothetical protein
MHSLESEGLGDDCDGESASLLSYFRYYRNATCACATTHASGNKDHISTLNEVFDYATTFLGCFAPNLMIATGAQTPGQFLTQLNSSGSLSQSESLAIGIHGYKVNALYSFADHACDGIATAAANANGFDFCWGWSINLLCHSNLLSQVRTETAF